MILYFFLRNFDDPLRLRMGIFAVDNLFSGKFRGKYIYFLPRRCHLLVLKIKLHKIYFGKTVAPTINERY